MRLLEGGPWGQRAEASGQFLNHAVPWLWGVLHTRPSLPTQVPATRPPKLLPQSPWGPRPEQAGCLRPTLQLGPGAGTVLPGGRPLESPARGLLSLCRPRPWPELAWTWEGCRYRWLTCRSQTQRHPASPAGLVPAPRSPRVPGEAGPGCHLHQPLAGGCWRAGTTTGQSLAPSQERCALGKSLVLQAPVSPPPTTEGSPYPSCATPPPPAPAEHTLLQASRAGPRAAQPSLHAPQWAACRNGLHAPRARPAPPSDVPGMALEGPGAGRGSWPWPAQCMARPRPQPPTQPVTVLVFPDHDCPGQSGDAGQVVSSRVAQAQARGMWCTVSLSHGKTWVREDVGSSGHGGDGGLPSPALGSPSACTLLPGEPALFVGRWGRALPSPPGSQEEGATGSGSGGWL